MANNCRVYFFAAHCMLPCTKNGIFSIFGHAGTFTYYPLTTIPNLRRAVAQHCINGDSLSKWSRAKFDPYRMEIPEPIAKKIGTVDYVWKATPCAKFRANPSTGGFSANAWTITEIFLRYTFFSENHLHVRPLDRFSRAMAQTTRSHARVCLFEVTTSKINI